MMGCLYWFKFAHDNEFLDEGGFKDDGDDDVHLLGEVSFRISVPLLASAPYSAYMLSIVVPGTTVTNNRLIRSPLNWTLLESRAALPMTVPKVSQANDLICGEVVANLRKAVVLRR